MATIELTDNASLKISSAATGPNSALDKYLQSGLVFLFRNLSGDFKQAEKKQISELNQDTFPLSLSASMPGSFKVEQATLNIKPTASAAIDLFTGNKARDFLKCVDVEDKTSPELLSFAFTGGLEAGPHGTTGDFGLGLSSGQQITVTNYCHVAPTDLFPDAVKRAISGVSIPHDLDDLRNLREGDICRTEGKGTVRFTASVQYSFLNNTLASQPLEFVSQSLNVKAQSGVKLQVAVEHSDTHQVTIAALGNSKVRLGVSTTALADIETSLAVSIGVSTNVGSLDALDFMLQQISPGPVAELQKIREALPAGAQGDLSGQIKKVLQDTMGGGAKASIQESLEKSRERNHLFVYEVDLGALDSDSAKAVEAALSGDFTQITDSTRSLAGIREIDAFSTLTLTTKHALTVHLIGILNFRDVSSFVQKAKVALNGDTGEVVLAATEIKIVENNLDTDHLRQALLKSAMITTAAVSSPQSPNFRFKMVFFRRKARPGASDEQQFLNVLRAIGSPDSVNAEGLLKPASKSVSAAGIYLSLNLDKDLSLALFRGRTSDDFVLAGQRAMRTILAKDDASVRRLPLFSVDLAFWKQLRDEGTRQNILALLATRGITDAATVVDFYGVDWWAQSMGSVASALATGQSLADAEKHALKDSEGGFDIPWALLATYFLIGPQVSVESKFTVTPAAATQTARTGAI